MLSEQLTPSKAFLNNLTLNAATATTSNHQTSTVTNHLQNKRSSKGKNYYK